MKHGSVRAGGVVALLCLTALALTATPARTIEARLSGAPSPIWQTNLTVWALAYADGVVYAGGDFTSVRPAGAPPGTGEVPRSHIAAFDASTGDLLPFAPAADARVRTLAVGPNGKVLYIGGNFTLIDGVTRNHAAAVDIPTGALTGWAGGTNGAVLAIATYGTTVYMGGTFTEVKGIARTRLAAVSNTGVLQPWDPGADATVTALTVTPDGSRVVAGGAFDILAGLPEHGLGGIDPTTGAATAWASTSAVPECSAVHALVSDGARVYAGADGTGVGCFDGTLAVRPEDGSLVWQDFCLGATQALAVIGDFLFTGSHVHDCAQVPGGMPNIVPLYRHLLAERVSDGYPAGAWFPNTNATDDGPRALATDGVNLWLGGDFTTVQGTPQQGLAWFGPGPDTTTPTTPIKPVAISTAAGTASVSWPASTDLDDEDLTYFLYRDGPQNLIATLHAFSTPWTRPVLRYRDAGLTPGSQHVYLVSASDGTSTSTRSSASDPVVVSATSPPQTYPEAVLADGPDLYWRLGETSGTVAQDASGHGRTGTYQAGTSQGQPGAIPDDPDTAVGLDGITGLVSRSHLSMAPPLAFTEELWFMTTSIRGGMLTGYGNKKRGSSTRYDRQVFMTSSGRLVFATASDFARYRIRSTWSYNDGTWHHLAATLEADGGMALYVDGAMVAGGAARSPVTPYPGFWRVGGDDLERWAPPSEYLSPAPPSYYLQGTVDEFALYPYALSAEAVAAHYAANTLNH